MIFPILVPPVEQVPTCPKVECIIVRIWWSDEALRSYYSWQYDQLVDSFQAPIRFINGKAYIMGKEEYIKVMITLVKKLK